MGADLLLHHVWIKRAQEPDWQAAKATIEAMTDEEIEKLESFEYSEEGTPEEYRYLLVSDLEEIKEVWHNDRRDAYKCPLGPIDCLITGGMSWGDDPSEFFSLVGRFLEVDAAINAAGFYKWEWEVA